MTRCWALLGLAVIGGPVEVPGPVPMLIEEPFEELHLLLDPVHNSGW